MRKPGCAECERLWEEYRVATFEHVKIDNRKKIADMGQNSTAELNRAHDEATQKREDAQQRMKEHEAIHAEGDEATMD